MAEERIGSAQIFDGRLIQVRVDRVRLPSGRESTREVVEHPGAVAILPVTARGTFLLVRQFRYAVGRELLEVPAGTLEPGESPETCAARELREEIGAVADSIEPLARFYVSPGWCNEELIAFRATGLTMVGAQPEQDEWLETVEVRPGEFPGLMRDGSIADAKTITAILSHLAASASGDS